MKQTYLERVKSLIINIIPICDGGRVDQADTDLIKEKHRCHWQENSLGKAPIDPRLQGL